MKKVIACFVVCTTNLLMLTNSYGQTLKLPTPKLKAFDVENYLPELGPLHINNNSMTQKSEITETTAASLLSHQLQKASSAMGTNSYDVHKLPIDQMPCIVPNNNVCYKMNVLKTDNSVAANMPNAMQKQNLLHAESKK